MRRFYQSYQIQQTVSVKLSWLHYCELLSISDPDKRSFYEKETINSVWSIRELKRQISTSLYERLLLSEGVVSLKRLLNQLNLKSWSSKMIKKSLEAYFFTLKNKIVFCKKQFQNMSVFCFVSTEIV